MRDKIIELLEENVDLPPLPKVLIELQKLINDPNCNVDDIQRLIKSDMVLTGKMLTLANNVYFAGGREKADEIEEAIIRLGVKMVLDLCYGIELPRTFKKTESFDQTLFWKHSIAVGYLTRLITTQLVEDQETIDMSFTSGLMHDLGILVFDSLIPKEYNKIFVSQEMSRSDKSVQVLEKETFGIDHQELGAKFLEKWWDLPSKITEAVKVHHDDYQGDGKNVTLAEALSGANKLANENGISHPVMSRYQEALSEDFIKKNGISDDEKAFWIDQTRIGLLAFDCLIES